MIFKSKKKKLEDRVQRLEKIVGKVENIADFIGLYEIFKRLDDRIEERHVQMFAIVDSAIEKLDNKISSLARRLDEEMSFRKYPNGRIVKEFIYTDEAKYVIGLTEYSINSLSVSAVKEFAVKDNILCVWPKNESGPIYYMLRGGIAILLDNAAFDFEGVERNEVDSK